MPIYKYRCPVCLYEIEVIQKMNDDPPSCEVCADSAGEHEMFRVFDASGGIFILKGSGWPGKEMKK
jgi:putative FmdB family regulatory protein